MSSERQPRKETFLHIFMLWVTLCLLRMAALHPMAIFTVISGLIAFKLRDRLEFTNRQLGIAATVVLMANLVLNRTIQETGYFLGIGSISFAHLMSWMLILMLVVKRNENTKFARHGLTASVLIACAMSTYLWVVLPLAGVGVLLMVLAFREGQGLKVGRAHIAPAILILGLAAGLTTVATLSETRLGYLLRLFSIVPSSGIRFPPNATLDALQRWNGSDLVVLRVYGKSPPPYLIGRTYDAYDDRSFWLWRNTKIELKAEETVSLSTPSGRQDLPRIYPRGEKVGEPGSEVVRIEYPGGGSGYTLYAPREFHSLASSLDVVHRYSSGRLEERAKDRFDGSYYLFPFQDNGWDPPEPPGASGEIPPELAVNLSLPPTLTPLVAKLAHEIAGSQTDPARKADFITSFLQNKFTYGYDYPFEKGGDALEEFLRDRPPAHCEFFATSAALMLRTQGVPTRYITGFVVQEKAVGDGYYVIRLKHAHAWIEVFLPGQGWVTYDPTPPGVLASPESKAGFSRALAEWLSNQWRKAMALFTLSPKELWARLVTMAKGVSWVHLIALLALVGLYRAGKAYLAYLKKKRKKEAQWRFAEGRHDQLTPMLERLQDAVSPIEWRRDFHETPHEWLDRLGDSTAPEALLEQLQGFLDRYRTHRYSERLTEAEAGELESQLVALEARFKGNSLEPRERPPQDERDSQEVQA